MQGTYYRCDEFTVLRSHLASRNIPRLAIMFRGCEAHLTREEASALNAAIMQYLIDTAPVQVEGKVTAGDKCKWCGLVISNDDVWRMGRMGEPHCHAEERGEVSAMAKLHNMEHSED